jgi:hypothetical protein
MANSKLTFRKINFTIDDDLTHCEVRWESDDPILCGYGARRTFAPTTTVQEILASIDMSVLTDDKWTVIR